MQEKFFLKNSSSLHYLRKGQDFIVEREAAIQKLAHLVNKDLRELADYYGVTVFKDGGGKNKGWAGHVLEKYIGLPISSSQEPNAGSWELKLISLRYLKSGKLTVKETMQVTKFNPNNVRQTDFEYSHLLAKLRRVVIGARIWESTQDEKSIFYGVTTFDLLDDREVYNQIRDDYNLVRETIRTKGFSALKSEMGKYIQPRAKGRGHGSTSRAFYARRSFLKKFVLPLLSEQK